MKIHKEGYATLILMAALLAVINVIVFFIGCPPLFYCMLVASVLFYLALASFFRIPARVFTLQDNAIIAPADGKVVVIEKTIEQEYFKDERIQISVFMSPANVHVNRYSLSGIVKYVKYHPGKYLVAWHPKSSLENERNTVIIENKSATILIRQIAGKMARRIVCYAKEGLAVKQNEELGFIKFGSRVDVFLPLNAEIKVKIGQTVQNGKTILAILPGNKS